MAVPRNDWNSRLHEKVFSLCLSDNTGEDGTPKVTVERMFGCRCVIRLSEKLSLNSADAGPVGNPLDSGVCERHKKRTDSKRND
jgi:hypothetical protein